MPWAWKACICTAFRWRFGLVFAAVMAVFCLDLARSRSAVLFSFSFLGIVYLLRAMGDIGKRKEIDITDQPPGLMQRARVFTENRRVTRYLSWIAKLPSLYSLPFI
jgi:putative exporter of polyketide antibiotics